MTDTNKTLTEVNEIIDYLKGKVDTNTALTADEKAAIEQRITELRNNTESHELSLTGIQNLGSWFATEKTKLETAKKQAQEDKETTEKALDQLKQDISDKLTPALITELQKYPDLATALNEIKNKGVNYVVDLSSVNTKLDELANKQTKLTPPDNSPLPSWVGITGLITGSGSFLLGLYLAFFKSDKKEKRLYF